MDQLTATLVGLLQDIGKFWQRAASSPAQSLAPGFETFSRDDCGQNRAHATWSTSFVDHYLTKPLQKELSAILIEHDPKTSAEVRLFALADRLASGEREDVEEKQPLQLLSIFTQLGEQPLTPTHLPITQQSLANKASLFPINGKSNAHESAYHLEYSALWKKFAEAASSLIFIEDRKTLISELLHLMAIYTANVPAASYRSIPDVSLYDHSRVMSAIASCLTVFDDTTVQRLFDSVDAVNGKVNAQSDNTPVACLVEGDISGVQRFIYTITARGATPALRGRSFYLQMLTHAIVHFILEKFSLSTANIIYAGGGHFYLLLPANTGPQLEEVQQQLDRIMLQHHNGDLYVALGSTLLTCNDFEPNKFSDAWRRAGQAVGVRKRRRFADSASSLFAVQGHGGNEESECQVCHYEGDDVVEVAKDEDDSAKVRKCALCRSLEGLGRDLRDASQLLMVEIPRASIVERTCHSILAEMGVAIALRRSDGDWTTFPKVAERALLLGLAEFPAREDSKGIGDRLQVPIGRGLRWSANISPKTKTGVRATFEHLQDAAKGIARLGVLRMDVDNLGWLFSQGFRRKDLKTQQEVNNATLSRVASVSSALSCFFEGWIGEICREINRNASDAGQTEPIYTIYSGGDDLFIVGAWSELPGLAKRIRDDFTEYVSQHPMIHLSGGMTLHGGKEPLYQAAEAAGDALEQAKDVTGKNAFTLFNHSVKWYEFTQVETVTSELESIVLDTGNRALLRILLDMHQQYINTRRQVLERFGGVNWSGQQQSVWGPYMWRTLYLLRRLAERQGKSHPASSQKIMEIAQQLQQTSFQDVERVGLAARWVEARTRSKDDENIQNSLP